MIQKPPGWQASQKSSEKQPCSTFNFLDKKNIDFRMLGLSSIVGGPTEARRGAEVGGAAPAYARGPGISRFQPHKHRIRRVPSFEVFRAPPPVSKSLAASCGHRASPRLRAPSQRPEPSLAAQEAGCGFVHRLDAPCSGLILLAKTYEALGRLGLQSLQQKKRTPFCAVALGLLREAYYDLLLQMNSGQVATSPRISAAEVLLWWCRH